MHLSRHPELFWKMKLDTTGNLTHTSSVTKGWRKWAVALWRVAWNRSRRKKSWISSLLLFSWREAEEGDTSHLVALTQNKSTRRFPLGWTSLSFSHFTCLNQQRMKGSNRETTNKRWSHVVHTKHSPCREKVSWCLCITRVEWTAKWMITPKRSFSTDTLFVSLFSPVVRGKGPEMAMQR